MDKHLALVLAGGGALGAYEIGVFEVLKEKGFVFDIITGTSIGAINGAFIAAGQFEDVKKLWFDASPDIVTKEGINITPNLLKEYSYNYKKLIKAGKSFIKNKFSMNNAPFKDYIKEHLDVDSLSKTNIKFGITTTRIPMFKGEEVIVNNLEKDKILPYIHASSACVPVFPIETIDNKKYIDGVYHDNLPIKFAFSLGASNVVAIDLRLFAMKPQNDFFLNLPNVIYIAPYISLGSMMDFDNNKVNKNIILGKLDAYKHFKDLRGYVFAFESENVENSHTFIRKVVEKYGKKSKIVFKVLSNKIRTKMDEIDYFYRSLELILISIKYKNYYKTLKIVEVKHLLSIYIKSHYGNKDELDVNQFTKKKFSGVMRKYMNDFIHYLYKEF